MTDVTHNDEGASITRHYIRFNGSNFVLIALDSTDVEQWVDAMPTLEGLVRRVFDKHSIVVMLPVTIKSLLVQRKAAT